MKDLWLRVIDTDGVTYEMVEAIEVTDDGFLLRMPEGSRHIPADQVARIGVFQT